MFRCCAMRGSGGFRGGERGGKHFTGGGRIVKSLEFGHIHIMVENIMNQKHR